MKAQTWVIIVKLKVAREVQKPTGPFPFGPQKRSSHSIKITESTPIRLDKPMLLIPNGEAESVEIIPIVEQAILHSRNFRRRIR